MTFSRFRPRNPKAEAATAEAQGEEDDADESSKRTANGGAAMRIIVPLQGIVHGRTGLVLGSIIPCALVYFLQLYIRRNRSHPSHTAPSPSASASGIHRTPSRSSLSNRSSISPASVSSRALSIVKFGDSPYYAGLKKHAADPYHATHNPNGIIQLGLAENKLSLDLARDWIALHLKENSLLGRKDTELNIGGIVTYPPYAGLMESKIAVGGFMSQVMHTTFNPSQMILIAGATPAIEMLGFCLGDPGNAFLVPSPYNPGFDRDVKMRTGLELVPVPCRSTDNFNLDIAALERAYVQTRKRGAKVSAILFSNPTNPVGNLISEDTLYSLLDFAREKNIHVISDETFAGSIHGRNEFTSMAKVVESGDFDRSRVHIIYSLSKALSLPGLRVGVIYSYNDIVLDAATRLARFCTISVPTQHLIASMLSDTKSAKEFVDKSRARLQKMYAAFVDGLKSLGIKCMESHGGFHCWADMSKLIRSYSEKGELELWNRLLNDAKINAIPGSACHCTEPGWFCFCFTALSEDDIPVVMERIRKISGRSH